MHVTTLGALALCHENLGQHEEAEKYFNDAIGAYNEHCDQAVDSGASMCQASDSDISLLADLNATAAMIHYHFAGNLLAQERWDDAKKVTEIALVLAENSRMPLNELEELQHCVHELWLEME
uniref:MalT-like TPR region domain-containing protein n=1 Tax=Hyaloperonospora arabidopsidis (strain Emoy2) TaxID=559515 RepID=M4C5J5_HYAAE